MSGFHPKKIFESARRDEAKGRVRSASRKYAKIASYLRQCGKAAEANQLLERAIKLYASAPRVYLEKVLCGIDLGESASANQALEEFMQVTAQKRKIREYALVVEAKLHSAPALREKYFKMYAEFEPQDSTALLGLARALLSQGNAAKAKEALVRALRTGTRLSDVASHLQSVLEALNDMEGLFYLQRYEAGDVSRPELILLLSEGRHVAAFEPSIAVNKDLGKMVADLEKELGPSMESANLEEGIEEFEAQLEHAAGNDGQSLFDLAIACGEMELYPSAIRLLSRVRRRDPVFWYAQALMAWFFRATGELLEALSCYQKCLRHTRDNTPYAIECRYQLVKIYDELGDVKKSWEHAEQLIEVAPDYRNIKEVLEKLKGSLDRLKQSA